MGADTGGRVRWLNDVRNLAASDKSYQMKIFAALSANDITLHIAVTRPASSPQLGSLRLT